MKIDNLVKYIHHFNNNCCLYNNKYNQLSNAIRFKFDDNILLVKDFNNSNNWNWIVRIFFKNEYIWFYIHHYNDIYFLNGSSFPSILGQNIFDAINFIDDNCCFKFNIDKLPIFSNKQVENLFKL